MARPSGIALAGGLYHLTAQGDGRDINYFDNEDRHKWLDVLGGVLLAPGLAGVDVPGSGVGPQVRGEARRV
jgi:hypothetical protein